VTDAAPEQATDAVFDAVRTPCWRLYTLSAFLLEMRLSQGPPACPHRRGAGPYGLRHDPSALDAAMT